MYHCVVDVGCTLFLSDVVELLAEASLLWFCDRCCGCPRPGGGAFGGGIIVVVVLGVLGGVVVRRSGTESSTDVHTAVAVVPLGCCGGALNSGGDGAGVFVFGAECVAMDVVVGGGCL